MVKIIKKIKNFLFLLDARISCFLLVFLAEGEKDGKVIRKIKRFLWRKTVGY